MNEQTGNGYQLLLLLMIFIVCLAVGQGISFILFKSIGLYPDQVADLPTVWERQIVRLSAILGHLTSFTVSSLLFLWLFHRSEIGTFLKTDELPSISVLIQCVILLFVAYPIVIQVTQWNMAIPLPEWAKVSSDASQNLLKGILNMNGVGELATTLFLVGIVPAIGEELLFRGIIQNKLTKLMNTHLAIFIASLLFSLTHMQLERFLPFLVLGLILGYSYHYTRNFWVPVIMHFLNNSFQVVGLYSNREMIENIDLNDVPELPLASVIFSIIATLGILTFLRNKYLNTTPLDDKQELTA